MPIVRGHHSFDDHFTQIPNAWVRDPQLSFKAKGLLALLMSHRSGWQVTIRSLAKTNNCGVDAIRSAINELLAAGYLERSESRSRNPLGHLEDYIYTTRDPASENPTLENPTLDNPITKKTIYQEEHLEELNPQPSVEDVSFDRFWEVYPLKRDKAAARRAFAKALKKVGTQAIVEGARRYAQDPNRSEQYTKYPATWLNAESWADGPLPEREKTAEEKAAIQQAINERKRAAEAEASRQLRAEMAEAERKARENPPERCEHDRIKVLCNRCPTPQVG